MSYFKNLTWVFVYRFEQEVLGAPVSLPPVTPVVEAVPVALAVPAVPAVPPVPVIRPIIATNTYQQVRSPFETFILQAWFT